MTRKEIMNNFIHVYSVGYGDLQHLFRFCNRIGYNSGVYGWNYDVFSLDNGNIAICTGYRSTPGKSIDRDIIRKYEQKAKDILCDYSYQYDEQKKRIDKLIKKFVIDIQK